MSNTATLIASAIGDARMAESKNDRIRIYANPIGGYAWDCHEADVIAFGAIGLTAVQYGPFGGEAHAINMAAVRSALQGEGFEVQG